MITQARLARLITLAREIIATYEGGEADARDALALRDAGGLSDAEVVDRVRLFSLRQTHALAPLVLELDREELRLRLSERKNDALRAKRARRKMRAGEARDAEDDDGTALRNAALHDAEADAIGRAIAGASARTQKDPLS